MIQVQKQDKKHTYSTKSGNFVRSKGECEIADFLFDQKIEFLYEPTVPLEERWNHPDFYLRQYNVFIEFFGWENDKKYDEKSRIKKKTFEKLHLNLISLYPFQLGSLGAVIRVEFIKKRHIPFPQIKYFDWKIPRKTT